MNKKEQAVIDTLQLTSEVCTQRSFSGLFKKMCEFVPKYFGFEAVGTLVYNPESKWAITFSICMSKHSLWLFSWLTFLRSCLPITWRKGGSSRQSFGRWRWRSTDSQYESCKWHACPRYAQKIWQKRRFHELGTEEQVEVAKYRWYRGVTNNGSAYGIYAQATGWRFRRFPR